MSGGLMARRRGLLAAASVALCIGGIGAVAQGVAVPLKAELEQHRLERVFEQRLAASATIEPEQGAPAAHGKDTAPRPSPKAIALPKTGPVARLSVERLGVKETILAGEATEDRLSRAPVMLKHGDRDNPVTVLAAHRDTHFLFIRDLQAGDEVSLQFVNGEAARYRITRLETVRWDAFTYPLDPAQPLLALATCYPFGGTEYGGPWRRVAWGEQIAS